MQAAEDAQESAKLLERAEAAAQSLGQQIEELKAAQAAKDKQLEQQEQQLQQQQQLQEQPQQPEEADGDDEFSAEDIDGKRLQLLTLAPSMPSDIYLAYVPDACTSHALGSQRRDGLVYS